jgi:Scavenger mRNA decapping enzyme C-term binding
MSDGHEKEKQSSLPPGDIVPDASTITPVVPAVALRQYTYDPAAVLASTSVAKTLTISDQHATILLTQGDDSGQQGLLKLTIVPFHKTDLACLPHRNDSEEKELSQDDKAANKVLYEQQEKEHSTKVLTFLSKFDWRMTSNSGAEYSFHEVFSKSASLDFETDANEPAFKKSKTEKESMVVSGEQNNVGSTMATTTPTFRAELIFPASERQLSRAMPSPGFALVTETPALYEAVTKPYIQSIVSSGSLSWLQNIVQVKKEKERLLHNAEKWILNVDTKWRSHPDALTIPREQWYQHESTADLYCLGIFKQDGIASLRDLTGLDSDDHISILREMLEQGPRVIETVYGVQRDQLRIFIHYQPQFYHFHVHYTRLQNEIGAQVEKAHLLSDIIQDLVVDPLCFQKKTLVYKLSLQDKLYRLLSNHGASES